MKKKVRETKTVSYAKEEIPMLKTGLTVGAIALAGFIGYRLFWPKLMALGSGGGGSQAQPLIERPERPEQYIPERPVQYIPERPVERPVERAIVIETYPEGYPYGYTGGLKPPIAPETTYQGVSPVVDFERFVGEAKAQAAKTAMPTFVPTGGYYVTESGGWVKGAGW